MPQAAGDVARKPLSSTPQARAAAQALATDTIKVRSLWGDALRRLLANRLAIFGATVVVFLFIAAAFGPWLTPYDYLKQDLLNTEAPPSWQHLLGTDELGRDFLSRIIYGARTALLVATMTSGVSTLVGVALGATAAYLRGWQDTLLMRLTDVIMAFPTFLLAVFINATLKPPIAATVTNVARAIGLPGLASSMVIDYVVVFGALALVQWPGLARIVRGQVLILRQTEYVVAAQAIGAPAGRIVRAHLLPNALGPIIVYLTQSFGWAMLTESALSFVGIGIQPPGASWGAMMGENLGMWRYKPHLVAVPGAVVATVVLAFNVLGDGLNDALNPRQTRSM